MFDISYHRTIAAAVVAGLGMSFPALAQTAVPIDSTLFTTYESYGNNNITWVTCGSTKNSDGCYGAGTLGPFGRVCAVMEGQPATVGNTVTRSLYVLAGGSNTSIVSLNVFKKTDTITSNSDTVSITPSKRLTLPLTGGSNALCSAVATRCAVWQPMMASSLSVRMRARRPLR
jgi:hypothetical protein